MNNNQPESNSDHNHDQPEWADFVDRRSQFNTSGESDGNARVSPSSTEGLDLNPDLLNDLELDGQLRVLGKMSAPNDSFVDAVVAKTNLGSNQPQSNRPRLPVLKPSPVLVTSEPIQQTTSGLLEGSAFSENDLSDGSTAPLSTELPLRRSVARFSALAATVLIGGFLASMWWFNSDQNITGPSVAPTIISKTDNSDSTSDPSEALEKIAPEMFPETDVAPSSFSANEALAEQSKDNNSGSGAMTAMTDQQEDRERMINDTQDANSNPSLVDVDKRFDSPIKSGEDVMPPFTDAENLENQKVEIAIAEGPIWESKLDWNLALQFEDNGVGSVALNGEPIQAVFLQDNAVFLLRQISSELQRRVQFMENRLGPKVNGSVSVAGANFRFDHISQLDEAVKAVDRHIATLDVRTPNLAELMVLRASYREAIIANLNQFDSIDLAGKNLSFYTEDEAFTICSVLSSSEALLRGLATKRLAWEKEKKIRSTKSNRAVAIAPKDFLQFAKSGVLNLPNPIFTDPSIARVQNFGPSALKQMLIDAPAVELFRNLQEFQEAKEYVYSNGPPDMKLRLSIDKMDRKLAERHLSDSMRDYLGDERSRLVRELGLAKMNLRNAGDGIAMQPLKDVLAKRTDLQGLPLTMGDACRSDVDETRDLRQVSSSVGKTVTLFNGHLGSRDAAQNDAFRNLLIKQMVSLCMKDHAENPTSQKLTTIDQILQIDHPRLRLEMIDALRNSNFDAAIKVLVNKAKFDLEPEVRGAAIEALADIAPNKIRQPLLEGLNYPWHVVAQHSAEALVRLNDQEAVATLIDMLDLPHPKLPIETSGEMVQRELVGINHMRNCLLCHAPSTNERDSVRGRIPHQSRPLTGSYIEELLGATEVPFAVRADITYLEQDFSVVLPVEKPGPWPREQRFDFVVQQKKLKPVKAKQEAMRILNSPNWNRNAIIFALQGLTGETPADNSSNNWRSIMAARQGNGE